MQQLLDDVFNVFTHVTGFGQGGGIRNHERHIEQPRQRLRKQRLAGPGRPDEQDVALGKLDFIGLAEMLEALVMVVNRDRKNALGGFLADHVRIKDRADFLRRWQVRLRRLGRIRGCGFVANDVVAKLDALIADEYRRACDEFSYFMLALAAKRAIEQFFAAGFLVRHLGWNLPESVCVA